MSLAPDDNSGIVTYLVGLTVLVLSAVGLSILVDKRFSFSSDVKDLEGEISDNARVIDELTIARDRKSELLSSGDDTQVANGREYKHLKSAAKTFEQERGTLQNQADILNQDIAEISSSFSSYRSAYREKVWRGAIGEALGEVRLKDGRVFRDVSITKVTEVGLEVRHEHGFARLQGPDLSQELQYRFQWNDEERRQRLQQELALQASIGRPVEVTPEPRSRRSSNARAARHHRAGSSSEEIAEQRRLVVGWRKKVSTLRSEKRQADRNARSGRAVSVPGSLETWPAKSSRLGRDLSKAQAALASAKGKLAAMSPRDPALREPLTVETAED